MKLIITLELNRVCKNSVRYDAISDVDKKRLPSIYIGNTAIAILNNPKSVTVTIEPASA